MQKIPFKPLGDRILLKEIAENQQVTKSGIILLETGNERPNKSEVIATGENNGKEATIKPGQTVLHGKAAGFKMMFDDQEYIIIRESDIFGVLD